MPKNNQTLGKLQKTMKHIGHMLHQQHGSARYRYINGFISSLQAYTMKRRFTINFILGTQEDQKKNFSVPTRYPKSNYNATSSRPSLMSCTYLFVDHIHRTLYKKNYMQIYTTKTSISKAQSPPMGKERDSLT